MVKIPPVSVVKLPHLTTFDFLVYMSKYLFTAGSSGADKFWARLKYMVLEL